MADIISFDLGDERNVASGRSAGVKGIVLSSPNLLMGILSHAIIIGLFAVGYAPEALVTLQANFTYIQVSGILLLGAILWQWRLLLVRLNKDRRNFEITKSVHMWFGIMLPVLFYVHSIKLGYAYESVLVSCLFITTISGLLSPQSINLKTKYYVFYWLIVHVVCATSTLLLSVYHLYVTYFYW
jgi:hypothetical protein